MSRAGWAWRLVGVVAVAAMLPIVGVGSPSAAAAGAQPYGWGIMNGPVPDPVSGLPASVSQFAVGGDQAGVGWALALSSDGTVWGWGSNNTGQLGSPPPPYDSSTPVQVPGLAGMVAIAAGGSHGLALRADGTVWAWGDDSYGQIGNGAVSATPVPATEVGGLPAVTAVSAGEYHSVALGNDGTVWEWGEDNGGGGVDVPTQVVGLPPAAAISAGNLDNLALAADGTVWAWGSNISGDLGDGSFDPMTQPVQTVGLTGVTAIAAGDFHNLALLGDGTVRAWGDNTFGQLGIGTTTGPQQCGTTSCSDTPVVVSGLSDVVSVGAGDGDSFAVDANGGVWAWGDDSYGQLGDGSTSTYSSVVNVTEPARVIGLGSTSMLAVGTHAALALALAPPTTPVITTPTAGGFANTHVVTIAGTGGPADTITVAVDGQPLAVTATVDGTGRWSLTATLAEGTHQVIASASDGGGFISDPSTSVTFDIDTTPPTSTISTAPGVLLLPGDHITGASTDTNSGIASVTLTFTPMIGPATTESATLTCTDSGQRNCTWQAALPILPGPYTINARARDAAGNTETPGPTITATAA